MSLNSLNSPTYDVDSRWVVCVLRAPPWGGQKSIYPFPNLHPIVRPPNLLIACTMLPSSHSAPTAYRPLPSPASNSSLAILPIASVLPPASAPSHSASRVHSLPPFVYILPSETENVDRPSSHSALRRTSAGPLPPASPSLLPTTTSCSRSSPACTRTTTSPSPPTRTRFLAPAPPLRRRFLGTVLVPHRVPAGYARQGTRTV